MSDVSFYGIFASLVFLTLSGIGLMVFVISLLVSLVKSSRNQESLLSQSSFGFVIGSIVPMILGVAALYTVVSITNSDVLKAFDNVVSFVVTVLGIACMIYIGRRWKRKRSNQV